MDIQSIKVSPRTQTGKGPARRGRVAGIIPAVLYGEGKEAVSISMDAKEFEHLVHSSLGEHAVLQVEVEGRPELSGPSMIKAIQHHPIREHVVHADFLRIKLDETITTLIPINITGRCKGIVEGGVPDQQLRELEIECLPLYVPEQFDLDITELHIGDLMHVSDLKTPENVKIVTDPERTVIAIHAPRVVATVEGEEDEAVAAGEGTAEA